MFMKTALFLATILFTSWSFAHSPCFIKLHIDDGTEIFVDANKITAISKAIVPAINPKSTMLSMMGTDRMVKESPEEVVKTVTELCASKK